jgi:YHS domain-containing protein
MRDPVCRMGLNPRQAAAMATHRSQAYYFCSAGCEVSSFANGLAM